MIQNLPQSVKLMVPVFELPSDMIRLQDLSMIKRSSRSSLVTAAYGKATRQHLQSHFGRESKVRAKVIFSQRVYNCSVTRATASLDQTLGQGVMIINRLSSDAREVVKQVFMDWVKKSLRLSASHAAALDQTGLAECVLQWPEFVDWLMLKSDFAQSLNAVAHPIKLPAGSTVWVMTFKSDKTSTNGATVECMSEIKVKT
ncbi:hypothetical protein MCEMSHM24_02481 [Comamonadaceae bacterium]